MAAAYFEGEVPYSGLAMDAAGKFLRCRCFHPSDSAPKKEIPAETYLVHNSVHHRSTEIAHAGDWNHGGSRLHC